MRMTKISKRYMFYCSACKNLTFLSTRCEKCGKELREGVKFCPGCGKVIENAFYLLTMLVGFLLWDRNKTKDEVKTETMGFSDYAILAVFTPLLMKKSSQ